MFAPYEYDTTSVTLLKFKDGRIGKVASVVDCLQPYYFHIHLIGSNGSLLDNQFYTNQIKGTSKDRWGHIGTSMIDSGDVDDHPYEPQFKAFIESIRNNTEMPLTDFKTTLMSHKVAFAADISARQKSPVRLSDLG
jgi:predicted dehydrogenase